MPHTSDKPTSLFRIEAFRFHNIQYIGIASSFRCYRYASRTSSINQSVLAISGQYETGASIPSVKQLPNLSMDTVCCPRQLKHGRSRFHKYPVPKHTRHVMVFIVAPAVGIEPTLRGLEALVLPLDEADLATLRRFELPFSTVTGWRSAVKLQGHLCYYSDVRYQLQAFLLGNLAFYQDVDLNDHLRIDFVL